MEGNIVFVMTPFYSHLLPTFKMAKRFQNENYKIIFISTPRFKRDIEENSFIFQNSSVRGVDGRILNTKELILLIIETHTPAFFLVELSFWNWALYLKGLNQKVMTVQTWLSANKVPYQRPTGFRLIKNRNPVTYILNEIQWKIYNLFSHHKFIRGNDFRYYRSIISDLGLDPSVEYLTIKDRTSYYRIKDVTELIFFPIEFNLKPKRDHNQKFIGPFIEINRGKGKFKWEEINYKSKNLIYCSLGSLSETYPERNKFFLNVINAVSKLEETILILSVGKGNEPFLKQSFPKNIFVYESVPQIQILRKAKVFITHGGAGSIKESILFKVPMLVYPWQSRSDMYGIADRIDYHNLGVKGDIRNDTPYDIISKILYVLNSKKIKTDIINMAELFNKYEKTEVQTIKNLINQS